jgi:ribosomal protein S18 acetylase RimI-like enzyme
MVRPVSLADAAPLHEACYAHTSLDAVRELLQRSLDLARRGRGLGLVAASCAEVYGYGQVTLWPRAAEISDLIVTAALRSQGIGTSIICGLLEQCTQAHVSKVEIGAALGNTRAIALYRRLGFRDERIIVLDLGDGPQPIIYLSMHLTNQDADLMRGERQRSLP